MTAQPYDRPTEPNAACAHKRVTHAHGTHACYVLDRCRCEPCKTANRSYERHRRQWAREFPYIPEPYVDADQARKLVDELRDRGLGLKRVAQVSGVAHGALWKLVYGVPGRGPSKRCRRETVERLQEALEAVTWEEATVADGARVDATEARLIVKELVARGWAQSEIATRIAGAPRQSLQAVRKSSKQVQARTLRVLRELMCEPVPLRKHPTGKLYQPKPKRPPRAVPRLVDGVGGPIFREPIPNTERILDLLELEGWMSYPAISERLGLAESSVATLVSRIADRLEKRYVESSGTIRHVEVRIRGEA